MKNINFELLFKGIVCYAFGSIGAILMLLLYGNNNRLIRFHASQSMVFYLLIYLVQNIFAFSHLGFLYLGYVFFALKVAIIIFGAMHVSQERCVRYPIIGDIVIKFFN